MLGRNSPPPHIRYKVLGTWVIHIFWAGKRFFSTVDGLAMHGHLLWRTADGLEEEKGVEDQHLAGVDSVLHTLYNGPLADSPWRA